MLLSPGAAAIAAREEQPVAETYGWGCRKKMALDFLSVDNQPEAECCFQQAIAIAQTQQAKS